MILDFEYRNKQILISEIDENGDIKVNYYPWESPKKFVPCDESDPDKHAKFTTWDKKPVKLQYTSRPNRFAIYEYLDRLPEKERERLFSYKEPKTYFVDIETEILDSGFVEPKDATSRVLTIAIVKDRKVWVLGIKRLSKQSCNKIKQRIEKHFEKFDIEIEFKYMTFYNRENPEKEMLRYFFEQLVPKMPVISGWNFLDYDWTFLINRYRRLGLKPEVSSYTRKLEKIFNTEYEVPAHRLIIDYMEIYKKWDTSVKVKESNSLNWVGGKVLELDHAAKVQYSGGLQDLYNDDFETYVFYNAVDTVLVQLIHEKMRYIDIAFSISALAKIRLCDFAYKNLNATLVTTEGFLRENFREKKNIVLCKDYEDIDPDSIPGGWVKNPNRGMNEWVATFDFASLYPTVQRQQNIAPETFKGFQMPENPQFANFDGVLNEIKEDDVVCVNGAVFSKEESVTVNFLEEVYSERQRYKAMMKTKNKEIDVIGKEITTLEKELEELQNG
jgi:DNA polymerase elongation subunit (family B)